MKKRWIPALLALLLTVGLLPVPGRAVAAGNAAGDRLTGVERAVYDYLKEEAAKVAKGARTSTEFRIPDQSALSWPLSELGTTGTSVSAKAEEKMAEVLNVERVFHCLSLDCPYELFWRNDRFAWGYSLSRSGDRVTVKNLIIRLEVAESYRGGSAVTVNPSRITAANQAAANAQAIVAKYQGLSDMDKLAAYREEICALVSYNTAAAQENMPYGDPWQMIYVFDGDPATNVVCEGYSKAFQYLCDLSQFEGAVLCRTVSGTMDRENHMWNVVQMEDGKNYLVDVTNCDSGSIGAPDKLFLAGGTREGSGQSYIIPLNPGSIAYAYGSEQKDLYTDGWLALSDSAYVYDPSAVRPGAAGFTDVPSWFETEVAWAAREGITNGYGGSTTFAPNVECPHTQILTFLWRAADKPAASAKAPFTVGASYQDAVNWAYEKGLIGDSFDPDALCTRADAVSYIWQALDRPEAGDAAAFSDVDAAAPYAGAVSWAVEKGVTRGYGGSGAFAPDRVCTRGEIAAFLYRAYH